jgi:mono/diheme cytochrome c family protein
MMAVLSNPAAPDLVTMIRVIRMTHMKYLCPSIAALLLAHTVALAAEQAPIVAMPSQHQALLKDHCGKCHGEQQQEGSFRVDDLPLTITTLESAERWQKVLNQLNSGDMPPDDEKQPDGVAKTNFLDDLAHVMVAARKSLGDQQGVITMRRLNRREYRNTLRELLGVEINVSELPPDTASEGFDTAGANLFMSSNQFEQYQSLSREALTEAFERQAAATVEEKLHYEAEAWTPMVQKYVTHQIDARDRAQKWIKAVEDAAALPENADIVATIKAETKNDSRFRREWARIPGAPNPRSFGFNKGNENDADLAHEQLPASWLSYHQSYLQQPGVDTGAWLGTHTMHHSVINVNSIELLVPFGWPVGEYVVRVRVAAKNDTPPERRFMEFGRDPRSDGQVLSTHHVTGTMDDPQVIEIPLLMTRGNADRANRMVFVREKGSWDDNYEGGRKRDAAKKSNGVGPDFALWVDWIEIERKPDAAKPKPPGIAALGIPLDDKSPQPALAELRAAFERFAREAFRGTPAPLHFIERLLTLYEVRTRAGDKPAAALKQTLSVALASPMFLYLAEPSADGKKRPLTDHELAVRLSYFLWSAPPDAELRELAQTGELSKPEVLSAQTERLLNDPRSAGFLAAFTHQWLGLERFDFFKINLPLYPRFDNSTKIDARHEVDETLAYLLKHNGSLRDLLKSDYVVINSLLANYYGIAGVEGDAFRRVALSEGSPRGGLLGMAAIQFMGGNGERTSPVERGAWVLRKLLNDPPPPAPANIPAITRLAGQVLTPRERLLAHQEDPQCASCHRKIDPIGLGLENFDAAGQWRTEDSYTAVDTAGKPDQRSKKTWTIDTASALHKGPAFQDYFALRDIIASKPDAFARGFSTALIEFALGRSIGFRDEPLIEEMLRESGRKNFAVREFIHTLVRSEEFHTK